MPDYMDAISAAWRTEEVSQYGTHKEYEIWAQKDWIYTNVTTGKEEEEVITGR